MEKEVWYELQSSLRGADDWFSMGSGANADTIESARENARNLGTLPEFELRIVKKTLVEEVVS